MSFSTPKSITTTTNTLTDLEKSQKVSKELIETEKSYYDRLIIIEKLFMNPLKDILQEDDHNSLFKLIPPLITSSAYLLKSIRESKHSLSQILHNFLTKHASPLITFCVNHKEINSTISNLMKKNDLFYKFCTSTLSNPSCNGLDLQSYFLEPVQRVSRYPLLLKELLHYTPKGEKEHDEMIFALEAAELFVRMTNEAVREDEAKEILYLRMQSIKGGNDSLLTLLEGNTRKNRKRIFKTEIRLLKNCFSKTKILCILLSDLLILFEVEDSSSWKEEDEIKGMGALTLHKEPMILDDISIIGSTISGGKPFIEIRKRDNTKLGFLCLSTEEKISFLKEFNQTKREITSNISDLSEIRVPLSLPSCGTLLVEVRGLKNYHSSNMDNKSEVYMIIQLNDQLIELERSNNARWNIGHVLSMRSLDDHILFKAFEYDPWGPPSLIGSTEMSLDLLEYYGEKMTEPISLRMGSLELEILLQYRSFH